MPPPSPDLLLSESPGAATPWVEAERPSVVALAGRLACWPVLVWRRRDLVLTSVRRDLGARLRGTALGWLWMLAQPLLLFGVYAFLFTTLLGVRIGGAGVPPGAMGVYMFTGTLVWASFSEALTRSATCVVDQGHLVRSVRFPAELLPLQVSLSALVTFVMGAAAFVGFTLVSEVWPAPAAGALAWAPLLLLLQLLLSTGFGLLLASVNVLWRDVAPLLGVLLTVWMFATPVFWVASPELLPGVAPYLDWIEANPLYHLVQAWRVVLMGSEPRAAFAVGFGDSLVQLCAWSLGVFALGSLTFFRLQRHLADEV